MQAETQRPSIITVWPEARLAVLVEVLPDLPTPVVRNPNRRMACPYARKQKRCREQRNRIFINCPPSDFWSPFKPTATIVPRCDTPELFLGRNLCRSMKEFKRLQNDVVVERPEVTAAAR